MGLVSQASESLLLQPHPDSADIQCLSLIYGVKKYGSAEVGDATFASTSIHKDIIFSVSILATIVPRLKLSGDRITPSLLLTVLVIFFFAAIFSPYKAAHPYGPLYRS